MKTMKWKSKFLSKSNWIGFLLIILFASGCSKTYMPPEYRTAIEQSAVNLNILNDRCQDGDIEACREGCRVASETLNVIIEGLYGIADNQPIIPTEK